MENPAQDFPRRWPAEACARAECRLFVRGGGFPSLRLLALPARAVHVSL